MIDAKAMLICCIAGWGWGGGRRLHVLNNAKRGKQIAIWPQAKATEYPSRRQAQALTVKTLGYVFGYVEKENAPEGAS